MRGDPRGNGVGKITAAEAEELIKELQVLLKCGYEAKDLAIVRLPENKQPQFIPKSFFHDQHYR